MFLIKTLLLWYEIMLFINDTTPHHTVPNKILTKYHPVRYAVNTLKELFWWKFKPPNQYHKYLEHQPLTTSVCRTPKFSALLWFQSFHFLLEIIKYQKKKTKKKSKSSLLILSHECDMLILLNINMRITYFKDKRQFNICWIGKKNFKLNFKENFILNFNDNWMNTSMMLGKVGKNKVNTELLNHCLLFVFPQEAKFFLT